MRLSSSPETPAQPWTFSEFMPLRLFALLVSAAIFLFCAALYCRADDAAAVLTEPSTVAYVWNLIAPVMAVVVSVFGPITGSYLVVQLISLLKITDQAKRVEVEQQLRWALHTAAESGLKYAFAKAGIPPSASPTAGVIADALFYVQGKNPDAVAAFDLDEDDLKHIILSKIPDLIASLAPVITTALAPIADAPAAPAPVPAAAPTPAAPAVA
jgi:hypothetical protein